MTQANRLLTIGCTAAAIGLALAISGAVGSSPDWVISALGLAVVAAALPSIVFGLRAKRRSPTVPETGHRPVSWRAIVGSYIEAARRSRKRQVFAVLGALWIVWNVIALVASIARGKWSSALVYGVVAAALFVLAYVRAAAPNRPTT